MAKGLLPAELKALQHIHTLMLALEKSLGEVPGASASEVRSSSRSSASETKDPTPTSAAAVNSRLTRSDAELARICTALEALLPTDSLEVQKISEIAKHLRPGMSAKEFANWVVPVERLLGRQLRDDQFLVYATDSETAAGEKLPLVFVLDNLRSAFNVGSIFRTAECFGVEKIYLGGYTPAPEQGKVASTAMGTAALVEWEARPKILELLQELKSAGHAIIGFETTSHAVPLERPFQFAVPAMRPNVAPPGPSATNQSPPSPPTVFVFGNERFGLEPALLKLCDEVRKIPLRGKKNSLNVGVAVAIATYEFARQYSSRSETR
jgi:tRNA G18 (ribose-2'-O)-methylase SpoU